MKLTTLGTGIISAFAIACIRSSAVSTSAGDVLPERAPDSSTLPAGAVLRGALDHPLGPATSHVGDVVSITVSSQLTTKSRKTVVPTGAVAYGHITAINPANTVSGQGSVQLSFDSLLFDGRQHVLDANISKIDAANVSTRALDPSNATLNAASNSQAAAPTLVSFGSAAGQLAARTGVSLLVLSTVLLNPP